MRRTLYGQLMAITSVVLTAAMVLSLLAAFVMNALNASNDTEHHVLGTVPSIAAYVRREQFNRDSRIHIDRLARSLHGGIAVYTDTGTLLYGTGLRVSHSMVMKALADLDQNERPGVIHSLKQHGRSYVAVLSPVYIPSRHAVELVAVEAPVRPLLPTFRQIAPILVAILLSLLLAQLLWSIVIRRFTRPVEVITEWAGRLSQGDLRARLRGTEGVTELENLAQALQRMADALAAEQDRREAFLADVAHDLRTPLSVQRTLFMTLARQEGDSADVPRLARQAQAETERLIRLVNALLDMARLEAGQDLTAHEGFDLREPVAVAAATFELVARRRGVRFEVDLGSRPLPVVADADRVTQIATNLMDNALRYAGEGGFIRVETAASDDGARASLCVTDSGPGVPKDLRNTIWLRFSGGHRDDANGPAGLGLAISRALARAMGGDLQLLDDLPTRFVLTIPGGRASGGVRTGLP